MPTYQGYVSAHTEAHTKELKNYFRWRTISYMCRHILKYFWQIQNFDFMCQPIRISCRYIMYITWKLWHLYIWNDFWGLNLTYAWIIDERLMHMIVFHDLLAYNMQTCKCRHEMVKDVDQMWRHLKWGHYKHVKWKHAMVIFEIFWKWTLITCIIHTISHTFWEIKR